MDQDPTVEIVGTIGLTRVSFSILAVRFGSHRPRGIGELETTIVPFNPSRPFRIVWPHAWLGPNGLDSTHLILWARATLLRLTDWWGHRFGSSPSSGRACARAMAGGKWVLPCPLMESFKRLFAASN